MTAKEKQAQEKLAQEQAALVTRKAELLAVCVSACAELSKAVHMAEHKDADGNVYRTFTRRAHKAQEQGDGSYKAVETGRVTMIPAHSIPDVVDGVTITPEMRQQWNKVKRDMAHRMVLHPSMSVDAIGLSRDSSGRSRGVIRVVESTIPIRSESGEKLLSDVQKQLESVKL